MFSAKTRSSVSKVNNNNVAGSDETIHRITREKIVVRGNTTVRTLDSTTSFLPLIER